MSLKSMKNKMTPTDSTKSLEEVAKEEAFVRKQVGPERKLQIQKLMSEPQEPSPAAQALLKDRESDALKSDVFPAISKEMIIERKLIDPAPDSWNFFGKPDQESYDLLMRSILVEGLMNPITLWKQKDGRYMILSGHTRDSVFDDLFQASGDPKWLQIPAKFYEYDDITENDARRIIILANIAQRAKETPQVRIRCYGEYAKLTKERASYGSGIDVNEVVAKTFGINRATVFFYRRLENLIDPLLNRFCDGKIRRTEANILCGLSTQLQKYLVEKGYIDLLQKEHFPMLRKAKTKEDIDRIASAKPSAAKTHRYTVALKTERPRGTEIVGLCLPREERKRCHEILREAFQNADLDDKTKAMILAQL